MNSLTFLCSQSEVFLAKCQEIRKSNISIKWAVQLLDGVEVNQF